MQRQLFRHFIGLLLCIGFIISISTGCVKTENMRVASNAAEGEIDLTSWTPDDGVVELKGEWMLYPNELLTPEQLIQRGSGTQYFDLPGVYKSTSTGEALPVEGYGTLYLKVRIPSDERAYGLIVKQVLSASNVWVNGEKLSEVGQIGTSFETTKGSFERQLVMFNAHDHIDIVIQMSNFDNVAGKIRNIFLGTSQDIKRAYILSSAGDLIIVGGLFIMGIYHIAIYFKRRQNKTALYFAISCLFFALRNTLVGGRLIYEIYPTLPLGVLNRTAYLTAFLGFPFIALFFKEVLGNMIRVWPLRIVMGVSLVCSIITMVAPIAIYDAFLLYFEIAFLAFFAYALVIMIREAFKGKEGAMILLFGVIVFIIASVNDMLLQAGMIHTRSLGSVGFFIFIFSQSYLLASQFSNAYVRIEKLIEENKAVYRDPLTGLLNRRGFYDQGEVLLSELHAVKSGAVLIYGDLNRLKNVNDTYGHKEGDAAIQRAAALIKHAFRSEDVVARISGDEFVAIAKGEPTDALAKTIMARIHGYFDANHQTTDKVYTLSVSLGYALYDGKTPPSLDRLMDEADAMLYVEKEKLE